MAHSNKKYRILCVGTHHGPSNAWRRMQRFQALGHDTLALNTSSLGLVESQIIQRLLRRFAKGYLVKTLDRHLLAAVESFKPEIIFFEKSQWLRPEKIQQLRDLGPSGMQLMHYNPDEFFGEHSPKRWGFFEEAIPFYDLHLVPKPVNYEDYMKRGAKKVFVYDRGYDPALHRPVTLNEAEQKLFACKVGFIGKWAPHREEILAELIRRGLDIKIWGNGWKRRGKFWEIIKPQWSGPAQFGENYVKAICGMQVALHFLRRENRDEQDSRSFEIPACGRCMLAERSAAHDRLFKEDVEAVYFDENDIDELEAKIVALRDDPERCRQIGEAAYQRTQRSNYTHDDRLSEFLTLVERADEG